MNIPIYSKNYIVQEAEKMYIEKKIEALEKINNRILSAKVDIDHDMHHQKGKVFNVKVHMKIPKKLLMAEECGGTLAEAVDIIESELGAQLRKVKEKSRSKRLREARKQEE